MKKLAKELNMRIIMRMKGEFVHSFWGQASWLRVTGSILYLLM